jgi:hypothetical protein
MKGSRTRLRKVLPEREREAAAFPIHARDQTNRFAERPEFCDQYARDRGSTVPSSSRLALPGRKLQLTNPFISSPTTKTP